MIVLFKFRGSSPESYGSASVNLDLSEMKTEVRCVSFLVGRLVDFIRALKDLTIQKKQLMKQLLLLT